MNASRDATADRMAMMRRRPPNQKDTLGFASMIIIWAK